MWAIFFSLRWRSVMSSWVETQPAPGIILFEMAMVRPSPMSSVLDAQVSGSKLRQQGRRVLFRIAHKRAEPRAVLQQVGETDAGLNILFLEFVEIAISLVADQDAAFRIEQQQALRHIFYRGVKMDILRSQLAFTFLEFAGTVGDGAFEIALQRVEFVDR